MNQNGNEKVFPNVTPQNIKEEEEGEEGGGGGEILKVRNKI